MNREYSVWWRNGTREKINAGASVWSGWSHGNIHSGVMFQEYSLYLALIAVRGDIKGS